MSKANGHANGSDKSAALPPSMLVPPAPPRSATEGVNELITALEVPFDSAVIEWRVTVTTKHQQPVRGQVIPYADQRAYTDRLNALLTPAGWTRKYSLHTSTSVERNRDQKMVAKVLVTCELSIFGVGSHSATGEEWTDNDNACTSAEAQAFKRACSCFGLGRYLYHFAGTWVDLDDHKRPKTLPALPAWATPGGWKRGLRHDMHSTARPSSGSAAGGATSEIGNLVHEIEQMEEVLGKRMYHGLLKTIARVWSPRQIRDRAIERRVLEHMRAAERGFRRVEAALAQTGSEPLGEILQSLNLRTIRQVDSLATLHKIVVALEADRDHPGRTV